jgi:hypothetical protein
MQDIQKLDTVLAQLAQRYSINGLKLPAHGAIGLRLKDGSELYLEHEREQRKLYAYIALMRLPKEDAVRLKLLAAMLELNFLPSAAEHLILSTREESAICHTSFTIAELELECLDRSLQSLIASRTRIAEKLKAGMMNDTTRVATRRRSTSTLLAGFK